MNTFLRTAPLPLLLFLLLFSFTTSQTPPCPLNFTVLQKFVTTAQSSFDSTTVRCQYSLQGIHLVQAEYLRTASLFLPNPNSSSSCWLAFQSLVAQVYPNFDPRRDCGFSTEWISHGCMNITTRSAFESLVPSSALDNVRRRCNQSLSNAAACASCTTSLTSVKAAYLTGSVNGNNVSDCNSYPSIYAAGIVNPFGPADDSTASCFFSLYTSSPSSTSPSGGPGKWIYGVVIPAVVVVAMSGATVWICVRRRRSKRRKEANQKVNNARVLELDSISGHTTIVRYNFDEIKAATKNFSRENIIGKGGYGNVYKGVLADGTEVALKRFKNCSVAGDASFAHEVEVIASVRHVNLVALRGYCIATNPLEGHQRIIVCELMYNGSLHDHLFGLLLAAEGTKLSWPVRQKIALGTARGLAYLHFGAQPAIIHRDIKASNILLDEVFEPKVADFGLAKFVLEGASHLSTRVAGTLGYVAPEYALYGKLTEKSDVYSFGVLLLELLSGKKAVVSSSSGGNQTSLVTDWAWSLVRQGRALDVVEEGMEELGPLEVVEKYVLVAVLCSHPHLHARPSMDLVVKIFETNMPVPPIPDCPISIIADIDDIEKSVSDSGSGQLSSFAGYQLFTVGNDRSSSDS